MSEKGQDWGKELYEDVGWIGKVYANIGLVIAIIISIILLIAGIYMMANNKDAEYMNIVGIITKSECISEPPKDINTAATKRCRLNVEYNVNNVKYQKELYITGGNTVYLLNEPIELKVNRNNNSDAEVAGMGNFTIGLILIGVSLVILACGYFNYYLTHNSRLYAATSGVNNIVSIFRR